MYVKITTKSGNIHEIKNDKMIERDNDGFKCWIKYNSIDSYYHGDGQYKELKTLLKINLHSIESISYEEIKETK